MEQDQTANLKQDWAQQRQKVDFADRRRQSLIGAASLLLFFICFTAFQFFGYRLQGDPALLNLDAADFSVQVNVGVVLILALFIIVNIAAWSSHKSRERIYRVSAHAAISALLAIWLIHIHLAGSQNTVLVVLIPSTAVVVLWLFGPKAGWVYFGLGTLGLLFLSAFEILNLVPYFPLSVEGAEMKRLLLNFRVVAMNLILFLFGSGITLTFLHWFHRVLAAKTAALEAATVDLQAQASTDFLTGLYNRRYIIPYLEREIARTDRTNEPLTVAVLDLDDFKLVNDLHGHAAGDDTLRAVARLLRTCVRPYDVIARIGGEEFLVVLPGNGRKRGLALAERMRVKLAAEKIDIGAAEPVSVSGSIGVATRMPGEEGDVDAILKTADMSLYRAKQEGKNRVCG